MSEELSRNPIAEDKEVAEDANAPNTSIGENVPEPLNESLHQDHSQSSDNVNSGEPKEVAKDTKVHQEVPNNKEISIKSTSNGTFIPDPLNENSRRAPSRSSDKINGGEPDRKRQKVNEVKSIPRQPPNGMPWDSRHNVNPNQYDDRHDQDSRRYGRIEHRSYAGSRGVNSTGSLEMRVAADIKTEVMVNLESPADLATDVTADIKIKVGANITTEVISNLETLLVAVTDTSPTTLSADLPKVIAREPPVLDDTRTDRWFVVLPERDGWR